MGFFGWFKKIWYTRIGDAEERQLVTLRKQQREKIEEIKKKTNYYSTRTLIERYDEGPGADTPLRRRIPMQPPQGTPATPTTTSQRAPGLQPPKVVTPQTTAQVPTNLQQHLSPSPQRPMPPPRKQWYDKLADAILGDDDSTSAAASRYALICQKCFVHNGLVKESLWEDTREFTPRFRSDMSMFIALTPIPETPKICCLRVYIVTTPSQSTSAPNVDTSIRPSVP
ncbi:hypothetical protein EIP86_002726 [Pleurotus ostreatoroseus]|nr:hypothetical protein EIP86_002726 [Pleurotus ostreatoroseus]